VFDGIGSRQYRFQFGNVRASARRLRPGGRESVQISPILLDVFDRQLQLLRIELLRAAAELRALQLAQEVLEAIHPRQRLVALSDRSFALGDCSFALGNRRVALGARRYDQRLKRFGVGRKMICDVAHGRHSS
jgi:hypothetical protein